MTVARHVEAQVWDAARRHAPPQGVRGLGLSLSETKCERCGALCERGPYREQLCNRCALELGNQEIAERTKSNEPSRAT